ncbi:MAG: M28 family metallopeptidase [Vicinamibacteria bacterium]|nr:M28 family metallopeptidase [Vicinamibacteria bacterium]
MKRTARTWILRVVAGLVAGPVAGQALPGFTAAASARQREAERRLFALPEPARIEALHEELTRVPHVAGTAGGALVAGYVAAQLRAAGLEVETPTYDVLLSAPRQVEVELLAPRAIRLARTEQAIAGDSSTQRPAEPAWHAYAKSGEVEAEVVYVGFGRAADYDALAALGVDVRGKVALARSFKGYRGGKSQEAERRGVAALLTYSDPEEDGHVQGDVYPQGPWGDETHVQRGANVYDFVVPGDPLTPGWPSTPGARRIAEAESTILPRIPSAPLAFRDAREILQALGGPVRPTREWQGGGAFTYHVGPGPAKVRVKVDVSREVRPIRNVIARLPGADPDPEVARQVVLLSNHHDAWVFGGVDPSSGTAAGLELARALGELARAGMRPRRTILIAFWDAEEFTLTGSTEWGEQHAAWLARDAVAVLNVDAAASGDRLSAYAVPALRALVREAARDVADPKGRGSVYDVWRGGEGDNVRSYGTRVGVEDGEPVVRVLGSGSDYTVFFNHLGIASLDMIFDGPYGVYHSSHDSHEWSRRFGDPGFAYNAAMVRLWGLLALRLANADVPAFDYGAYGRDVLSYLDDVAAEARARGMALDLGAARVAAQRLAAAPRAAASGDAATDRARTRNALAAERALLEPAGIPGRPFFRHLVYAPRPSYEAMTLPGVREAVEAGDAGRAASQAALLAGALARAADVLDQP